MEHEFFNILFNRIAVTPQCVILSLSTLPLRPSSPLSSFSGAHFAGRIYSSPLCSSYNEAHLHTFTKLTKPFHLNISYSSTSPSHHRSHRARHPLPLSFARRLRLTRQPASLVLSHPLFPLSSCWANLMSVFISLTARHFSLLLQADTWPEWQPTGPAKWKPGQGCHVGLAPSCKPIRVVF